MKDAAPSALDPQFPPYLRDWRLSQDGAPIVTHSSLLLPVRTEGGAPAMIKLPHEIEEKRGAAVMVWWEGDGAAAVLAHGPEGALLMERATGPRSLADMAASEQDDEATRILCAGLAKLHGHGDHRAPPKSVVPLAAWFRELPPMAQARGGLLAEAADTALELLSTARDEAVLHGDMHHENLLDFEERGWLAIDPKGLWGERTFDYANLFRDPTPETALAPGVFERRLEVVTEAAGLDRERLLKWIFAYAALSAAWIYGDGEDSDPEQLNLDLSVMRLARKALGKA
ncbi:aminoglycoside phosphotransferase family protein [Caulobacter mirabilis]|uniref:APH(6) family putative aminoglycoside O-phosphotransferase n=1 Tax=Caulobacter mirabilis TaxID=69666 RepID=A0A2D2ASS5_9CAUL|nr:aminoglycoside phosphotransferase family protein [Caulobacter mirabilis]ATQ41068.1 APH(6) family putative aminoglycoside O-phosphotransferase [Caulobacter mirabilis]